MVIVRVEVNGKIIGPPFRYENDAHQWVDHWHPGERYSIITISGFRPWRSEYAAAPPGSPPDGEERSTDIRRR